MKVIMINGRLTAEAENLEDAKQLLANQAYERQTPNGAFACGLCTRSFVNAKGLTIHKSKMHPRIFARSKRESVIAPPMVLA